MYHGKAWVRPKWWKALCAVVLLGLGMQVVQARLSVQEQGVVTKDPETYVLGWASALRVINPADGHELFLPLLGNSHNKYGDNAIRGYDPLTNRWVYFQKDTGASKKWDTYASNRDNYTAWYVPWRDEVWVVGGAGAANHGIFSLREKRWTHLWERREQFGEGIVAMPKHVDQPYRPFNPAAATCPSIKTLIAYGGEIYGNPTSRLALIELNPKGPEPLRYVEPRIAGGPPPLMRLHNNAVCVDGSFYIVGGTYKGDDKQNTISRQLWRLDVAERKWERLADAPDMTDYPVVTYDNKQRKVVVYGGAGRNLFLVYDPATDTWLDRTAEIDLPGVKRHAGVYMVDADMHLYRGGSYYRHGNDQGWSAARKVYGVRLMGEMAKQPASARARATPTLPNRDTARDAKRDNSPSTSKDALQVAKHDDPPSASAPHFPPVYKVKLPHSEVKVHHDEAEFPSTDAVGLAQETKTATAPSRAQSSQASRASAPPAGGILTVQVATEPLPRSGNGPSPPIKHGRLAFDPNNERIYWIGGDYKGPGQWQSGRQELYSLNVTNYEWRLEYPYCARKGEVNPNHPDQVGWVWDGKREMFWMLPGLQYGPKTQCDGISNKVMGFDPKTRKWFVPDGQNNVNKIRRSYEKSKFAVYDRSTDRVYMFSDGNQVLIWNPNDHSWSDKQHIGLWNRVISGGYAAQVGREIFLLDARQSELVAYDIDSGSSRTVSKLPFKHRSEFSFFVYIPDYDVLYVHKYNRPKSDWLYYIEADYWQQLDLRAPNGHRPDGRHLVYHPPTQKILLIGDNEDPPEKQFYILTFGGKQ